MNASENSSARLLLQVTGPEDSFNFDFTVTICAVNIIAWLLLCLLQEDEYSSLSC
jgi:hypothetical protein